MVHCPSPCLITRGYILFSLSINQSASIYFSVSPPYTLLVILVSQHIIQVLYIHNIPLVSPLYPRKLMGARSSHLAAIFTTNRDNHLGWVHLSMSPTVDSPLPAEWTKWKCFFSCDQHFLPAVIEGTLYLEIPWAWVNIGIL